MLTIDAKNKDGRSLCAEVAAAQDVTVQSCEGQRFLCAGKKEGHAEIFGVPGNALGAYLCGARITVHGNALSLIHI